jgi:hypothetical protein
MTLEPSEIAGLRERLGDALCALLGPDGDGSVSQEQLRAKMGVDGPKLSELLSLEIANSGDLHIRPSRAHISRVRRAGTA